MRFDNLAPSQTFQVWDSIVLFSLIVGCIFSTASIQISWDWLSNWEPLNHHTKVWLLCIQELITNSSLNVWYKYVNYLSDKNQIDDLVLHTIIPVFISFSLAIWISIKLLYVPGGRTLERHISGIRQLSGVAAYKHAKRCLNSERKLGAYKGMFLHPKIQITKQAEIGNTLITGKPGSGKTVIITYLLKQLNMREDRLFIYDEKQEYTAKLYNPHDTILVAPWDKRSAVWDISKDLSTPIASANFAKHIIPETKDAIWCKSARLILTGIIVSLNKKHLNWGWRELFDHMTLDDEKLNLTLKEDFPEAVRFIEKNSRTTQGIMLTLLSELEWIRWLATAWPQSYKNGFSLHEWVHADSSQRKIIVQGQKRYLSVGAPLCNALMGTLTDEFLSMKKKRACYLVLDELANFPKSKALIRWIELARERGGKTIIGTQTISQITNIYGNNITDAFMSFFANLIALKVGSTGSTPKFISQALGERVVERPNYQNSRGITQTSWQHLTLPTVRTFELTELSPPNKVGVSGYLSINGWEATYKLTWPYTKMPTIARREETASWTRETPLSTNRESNYTFRKRIQQRRDEASKC
ncbi:type IV secretion system DNA-binding domain-containing protein [Vibrio sp. PBL-C16]|uniref:type IV secretion system DNA-binding domain-containing protein n=1 Tax=Vibrio sp. PBL-C16 TaxID=3104322 RepID=UPI002AB36528|nr:type IV secretion system DNA-binding domain-containing protein [Vibrio sp. PBL-C16]MDY8150690.1 type IV secretion system DNA-binding domain-containing protein [Vibrio sp. PBL-C16]